MLTTLRGARCVITGGAGFVGSHLVERLLNEGARVVVYDNFISGKRELLPSGAEVVEGDIRDVKKLLEAIQGAQVVFHLAALASVQDSIERPEEYHDVLCSGTFAVLEAARKVVSRPRVIVTSSAAVYGDQNIVCVHEGLFPKPKSPYAQNKFFSEEMAKLSSELYGVEAISIRPFNIYGARMNPDGPYSGVIGRFMKMRKEGGPLLVTGDGTQTRDFVHVRDIVAAYVAAALSNSVGEGEVINIASGTSVTLNELAEIIGGDVTYIPARIELKDSKADITRARELLSWTPRVSLEDGIAELKTEWGIV